MSTIERTKRKWSRFRWTAEQFQQAADEGWFGDRKVELLDGEVGWDVGGLVALTKNGWRLVEVWNISP